MNKTVAVITTINGPDHGSLRQWAEYWADRDSFLIVVPDRKTPEHLWGEAANPLPSTPEQALAQVAASKAAGQLPVGYLSPRSTLIDQSWVRDNHYSRKNLGYLLAARLGFTYVFETDDDNYPIPDVEYDKTPTFAYHEAQGNWYNPYEPIGIGLVPRGLPFEACKRDNHITSQCSAQIAIWSWLCDGTPDLWAANHAWHTSHVKNSMDRIVGLAPRCFSPINSQHTVWHLPTMLRAMYLPITCRGRETDIFRGAIALYEAWSKNRTAAFMGPGVFQERNEHDVVAEIYEEWRMMTTWQHNMNLRQLGDAGLCSEAAEIKAWVAYQDLCSEYLTDGDN